MTDTQIPRFYRPEYVRKEVLGGISKQTLWRLQLHERFPKSRALTPGKHVFLADEVHAWVNERLAA